jgi:ABC-type branched-subunit amino acid transport system permease subunit
MNIRSILRGGLVTGVVNVFFVLLGLTSLVGRISIERLNLSSPAPGAWAVLLIVALVGGAVVARRAGCMSWRETLVAGLLAGAPHGLIMALLTWLLGSLVGAGVEVFRWLVQLTAEAVHLLTLGRSPLVAAVVMFTALTGAALAGAASVQASARYRWREFLGDRWREARARFLAVPAVQDLARSNYSRYVWYGTGLLLLFAAPLVLGRYWNYTLGTVGIYVILGLGLNIVVGMAGLLDLGYVAFFAIGSYTVAMLTAPEPHSVMMDFWPTVPIGIILAAIVGVLLGLPVLRMRGDYLAIVTLGFGEIIRILSKSDALSAFTGGPRGIRGVGGPSLFGLNLSNNLYFMYFIILGIIVSAFATSRLQHSRVGRAWISMREDEDVAQAMGIYTLRYKLLAFAIGAAFAGFSGVISASRNRFTGPEDFTLLVSINVICLVIIGGMGSIPGVVVGALVLKGLPEILRELDDYRMLAFGALLVVMMIVRPEGLWPSSRTRMELYQDVDEDADERAGEALVCD